MRQPLFVRPNGELAAAGLAKVKTPAAGEFKNLACEDFFRMDTFLGFERGLGNRSDKPELVVGVSYDIHKDVDDALGLREPGEQDHAITDELRRVGAAGFNAFWRVILDGIKIDARGRGFQLAVQRFVAIANLISPELLSLTSSGSGRTKASWRPGPAMSLRQIAKLLGCPTRELRQVQRQFIKAWNFRVLVRPTRHKHK
jgi:hypothetical protein